MTGPEALHERALLHIRPGRSLVLSPEWRDDGLSVLFDRNSGDYWVVSATARKIVEHLAPDGPRIAGDLLRIAAAALSEDERPDAVDATASSVLDELVGLDILAAVSAPSASTAPERSA